MIFLIKSNPLVDTYFTRLPLNNVTANLESDEMKLANNGFDKLIIVGYGMQIL